MTITQGNKLAQDSSCNRNPGPRLSVTLNGIVNAFPMLTSGSGGAVHSAVSCLELTANQYRRFILPEISSVCKHLVYLSFESELKRINDDFMPGKDINCVFNVRITGGCIEV